MCLAITSQEEREREMVRVWKETIRGDGKIYGEDLSSAALFFWAAIVTLSIIASVILSCAGGASKDKASTTDTYGTTCAGCGAACGG